jgi:hypothetical protein
MGGPQSSYGRGSVQKDFQPLPVAQRYTTESQGGGTQNLLGEYRTFNKSFPATLPILMRYITLEYGLDDRRFESR